MSSVSSSSSVWCLCCWLGCRSPVGSRGSCWLFEPAVYEIAFHSIPYRGIFRYGKPGDVARDGHPPISWLVFLVCCDLFAWLMLLGSVGDELGATVSVVLRNHHCLPPVDLALPGNPRRDSVCCWQVARFVCCSLYVVDRPTVPARLLECLLGGFRCRR